MDPAAINPFLSWDERSLQMEDLLGDGLRCVSVILQLPCLESLHWTAVLQLLEALWQCRQMRTTHLGLGSGFCIQHQEATGLKTLFKDSPWPVDLQRRPLCLSLLVTGSFQSGDSFWIILPVSRMHSVMTSTAFRKRLCKERHNYQ